MAPMLQMRPCQRFLGRLLCWRACGNLNYGLPPQSHHCIDPNINGVQGIGGQGAAASCHLASHVLTDTFVMLLQGGRARGSERRQAPPRRLCAVEGRQAR